MSDKDTGNSYWLSPLVMQDGFALQFRDDHIHIELGKEFKGDSSKREVFWAVISQACQRHQTCRVLVEGFLPEGERDTADVIDAGQKTAVVPRLWLAFAITGFKPTEQSELYEVIAATRGVRVKFFSSTEKALAWLRNNAPR